jgi:D-3-phosphoglycerate dehydrogenase
MHVIGFDPYATNGTDARGDAVEMTDSLDELLAQSDVVSLHAAVTPDSAGMIGAGEFAAMPDGAIFLNTARAGLHDTDALVAALQSGHLGGAGLDHFEGEILPTDHPLVAMDNVVLTPHIGGATYDTEANHSALLVDDLARLLDGKRPINIANPEVLDR